MTKSWYMDLDTALYDAVSSKRGNDIDALLKAGANPNAMSRLSEFHLGLSKNLGIFNAIHIIIGQLAYFLGLKFSDPNEAGTPLHLAVKLEDRETVGKFIEQKADVNIANQSGWTALHFACQNADKELVKDLIKVKGNLNVKNNNGDTPLHVAMCSGNRTTIELIIKNNANVNIQNNDGDTPMHILARARDSERIYIVFSLLKFMANPEILNNKGQRPVDIDKSLLESERVKLLIPNTVWHRDHKVIKRVLIYYPELATYTALQAIACSDYDIFRIAKNHDPDMVSWVENGQTILHRAVMKNKDLKIIESLIKSGANVNALDSKGKSPLKCIIEDSCFMNRQELSGKVLLLLNAGASNKKLKENGKYSKLLSDEFILSYLESDIKNNHLEGLKNIINNHPKFKSSKELLSFTANNNPSLAANLIHSILDVKSFPWYGHIYNPFKQLSPEIEEDSRKCALAKHYGNKVFMAYEKLRDEMGQNDEMPAVVRLRQR